MGRHVTAYTNYVGEHRLFMSQSDLTPKEGAFPLELASILLVEADPGIRSSRSILLGALEHPVLAVAGYQDVSSLPADNNCCLVAIDLHPSEHEARRIALHVRSTWRTARILLFGEPSRDFDDWLYDDSVRTFWSPLTVIQTARRLIGADAD